MHLGHTNTSAFRHPLIDEDSGDDLGWSCACCGCSSCRSDLEDGDAGRRPTWRPQAVAQHARHQARRPGRPAQPF